MLATMPAWISKLSLRRRDASGAFDKSDTEQKIVVRKVAFSHVTLTDWKTAKAKQCTTWRRLWLATNMCSRYVRIIASHVAINPHILAATT